MPKISGTVILNPDINGWELKPKSPFKLPGWWLNYPSEKYEFVSWGYYSQYMEKMFQTTNQLHIVVLD